MTPDPARLVRLLTDAGFAPVGRGKFYARLAWPGDKDARRAGSVLVPLDPTAPEFAREIGIAMAELERAADVGRKAQWVLDELVGDQITEDAGMLVPPAEATTRPAVQLRFQITAPDGPDGNPPFVVGGVAVNTVIADSSAELDYWLKEAREGDIPVVWTQVATT